MHWVFAFMVAMVDSLRERYRAWSTAAGETFLAGLEKVSETKALQTRGRAKRMAADRGQLGLGTLLAAFVVVIAAFVVIIVVDSMDSALGDPSNSDLNNSSDSVLSGFSSMIDLVEPLLLIAIAVVIISLIRRVQ